jgi:6-phosphogluconolactonase (cycloisomerase 2 family)
VGIWPLVISLAGMAAFGGQAGAASPNMGGAPVAAAHSRSGLAVNEQGSASHRGAAFAMTNETRRNRIIEYRRARNGELTRVGSIRTRGRGTGTDLDTQGAVILSKDHRFLYATNAGSDNISVFRVRGSELTFVQKVYAMDVPNSLTMHGDLLYVLVGSVAGNGILGFKVADNGRLRPLRKSFRLLSSPIAVPGEVEFSPDGRLLLVTQKTTNVALSPKNAIDVFRVKSDGLTSMVPRRAASHGLRPFSLAFRGDGDLVVVEAFNAAEGKSAVSSYRVSRKGRLHVLSGSVRNGQTDACWIVVTDDGRHVFTANFGSGTISSYRFTRTGKLHLRDGKAASLGLLSQPVDLALSRDSRYLYLLLRGKGAVASFAVGDRGGLKPLGVETGGLPVADGASGLAAY